MGFDVFEGFINWLMGIFQWEVSIGNITISIGGVISFLFIFFVTFLITGITGRG